MRKIIFELLSLFLLVSCAGNIERKQPALSITQTAITKPVSSTTPVVTISPTNTEETTLPAYSLPVWMGDPAINILAALITDDYKRTRKISFYNAETGEKYDIPMPKDTSGYFWYDNAHFGFLSNDLMSTYKINMETGKVTKIAVSPQEVRLLNQEQDVDYQNLAGDKATALRVIPDYSSNSGVLFEQARKNDKSINRLFAARWSGDNSTIVVINTYTNQIVWESQSTNNVYGIEFLWSPTDENLLAYLQGKPEPLNDFIADSVTLTIVNVAKGEINSVYSGDFGTLKWSPDGNKILYQDPWFRNGYAFRDAPCILFLETNEIKCLQSIPHIIPPGYKLITTGIYKWGNNSNYIYYTYLYRTPDETEKLGNLCVYNLVEGIIHCPTQELEILHGRSIVYFDISPDEQYLHFCYSASTILNDYADTANDGIIKVDGTGFFSWVGAIIDGGPQSCSYNSIWRPSP